MNSSPNKDRNGLLGLVRDLCRLPQETEYVEFKVNNRNPEAIGEYISALANTAALLDKPHAYILWGVEDSTHVCKKTPRLPKATEESLASDPVSRNGTYQDDQGTGRH